MDKFKIITSVTKEILGNNDLETRFASEPEAVLSELLPSDYDGSEEERRALLEDIKARVAMWTRNTGVASR